MASNMIRKSAFKDNDYIEAKVLSSYESSSRSNISINIIPTVLYRYLKWIGLIEHSRENTLNRIIIFAFKIILIFVIVDNWIIYQSQTYNAIMKSLTAYVSSYIFSVAAWYGMHMKRKQLETLLHTLQELSLHQDQRKGNFIVLVLLSMPIFFSVFITLTVTESNSKFYSYGYDLRNPWAQIANVSIKAFLYRFVFPTLTNIIALLYCIVCMHCSTLVRQLHEEILMHPIETFVTSKRVEIMRQKARIEKVLSCVEDNFSLPSFFVIVANLVICASMLSIYIDLDSWVNHRVYLYVEWSLYVINSFGGLMITLWIASELPIQEQKLKEEFYAKARMKMLFAEIPEEPGIEKWLFDKPDFVFTGWNILSYRRSTVFAVVGTLITYTVIVVK
ncbi:uncharacterized protein NPIL_113581 [Nephila pilipes]|uniref:Gustatory receptor n=1 Tax=Nephila pilipes TaxID=299642 RepID=A0A8X6UP47_NEPPI|nr:uncharacterized protein NPIL_113581 [Nephila pilipes]